jgi:glycosyltransferase involved in cell wall biosynthesis
MEAAALGIPVVATDVRGCRQVVDDGSSGRLVPVGDLPALTEAIDSLVKDPERRARWGEAGHDKAIAEFDQQRVIQITMTVYDKLLADSSRRP